jgi:hypothetical protein
MDKTYNYQTQLEILRRAHESALGTLLTLEVACTYEAKHSHSGSDEYDQLCKQARELCASIAGMVGAVQTLSSV